MFNCGRITKQGRSLLVLLRPTGNNSSKYCALKIYIVLNFMQLEKK